MNTVVCDVNNCKYNDGHFCSNQVVSINQGICQTVYMGNQVRNPEKWDKRYSQVDNTQEQN